MTCPNCGHAAPPTSAARCGHCNYKLPANPQPQAALSIAVFPCWNCRHSNTAEAERCEHCNAKLQKTKTGNRKLEIGDESFSIPKPSDQRPQNPVTLKTCNPATFKFLSHDQ